MADRVNKRVNYFRTKSNNCFVSFYLTCERWRTSSNSASYYVQMDQER